MEDATSMAAATPSSCVAPTAANAAQKTRRSRGSLLETLLSKRQSEMSRKHAFMMGMCFQSSVKMQYCISCAIHSRVVRVRSTTDRRKREPPQRFIRRRDDAPKPGQPGQAGGVGGAPRPAGAGAAAPRV